jgi:hypothetical protein
LYILFHDASERFGFERRVRSGHEHLHIILFHKNICLSLRWWSRDRSTGGIGDPWFTFEKMFDNLDKKIKFRKLK